MNGLRPHLIIFDEFTSYLTRARDHQADLRLIQVLLARCDSSRSNKVRISEPERFELQRIANVNIPKPVKRAKRNKGKRYVRDIRPLLVAIQERIEARMAAEVTRKLAPTPTRIGDDLMDASQWIYKYLTTHTP